MNKKPSIVTQLLSLTKTMLTQVKAGCPVATEETQKERAKICEECPLFIREDFRCGSCFCYLKYKIAWATSKCPEDKWGEEKGKI